MNLPRSGGALDRERRMTRTLAQISTLALAAALAAPLAGAQTIAGSKQADVGKATVLHVDNYKAPMTTWGAPDLQGLWTNAALTTPARPKQYGDRLAMTPDEVKKIEGGDAADKAEHAKATDPNAKVTDLPVNCGRGFSGVNCGYNDFWVDPGSHVMNVNGEFRTSFLVEPKNGHLPPRPGGQPVGFGPGAGGPPPAAGPGAPGAGGEGGDARTMTE